jgi:formate hydrogenlyase transcriptional activator
LPRPRGVADRKPAEPTASQAEGFSATPTSVPLSIPESLSRSPESLTAYFAASEVGFCILDSSLHYLALNDALAKMSGIPAAEHLGKSIRDILGDFAEVLETSLRNVLAHGRPVSGITLRFALPGRSRPAHWIVHYLPLKDAAGKVTQIGAVVIEVTDEEKMDSGHGEPESLRQEKKVQHALAKINLLLAASVDVRLDFPQISAIVRRLLHQEYAALALRDAATGQLIPEALDFPIGKNLHVGAQIGAADEAGGKALQERTPLIFGAEQMQRFDPGVAADFASEGLKAFCCVPLLRPKGPLGVLVLGSTRTDAFRNEDFRLLNQIAMQLAIALENESAAREVEQLKQRLRHEKRYLEGEVRTQTHFEAIIGKSPTLLNVLGQVEIISSSDATVLLLGETGTGKGLVAQAVHHSSKRSSRNFVTLNCAAIPTGLLESELFGHEKGAFTGAVTQKTGRLELADGGTLFLDEIGDIPLELQPKLLRVLQDHEFERLGSTRTIKVDLRLIAATNRDLTNSVAQKQFRSDLFYRLNVFPIRLPALRERSADIPLLVRHFVKKFSVEMGRVIESIPDETMNALTQWQWPGNVRELENFIERSVILTEGSALWVPIEELRAQTLQIEQSLEQREREHIICILRETGGTIAGHAGAARRLGLKRTTLQSKMQKLGITREDYFGKNVNHR